MSEIDYMRAVRRAEARGQHVTAVYHSHVGADAYLSEMDLAFAENDLFPFPEAAQIVIAVWGRSVSAVGIFARETCGGVFVGASLEANGA